MLTKTGWNVTRRTELETVVNVREVIKREK
jgi:hypothetical protein